MAIVQVNILEAKNRLSELIRTACAGEEVIIANRGEPVARLAPIVKSPAGGASTGNAQAVLDWIAAHPLPGYARRTAEEIDADIAEERGSWD
jgi:prevent-host-death family protein